MCVSFRVSKNYILKCYKLKCSVLLVEKVVVEEVVLHISYQSFNLPMNARPSGPDCSKSGYCKSVQWINCYPSDKVYSNQYILSS